MSNLNFSESVAIEKNRLRSDAAYVGGLSIALTLVMQYAYSFFVKILMSFGILNVESLSKNFLGMNNTAFLIFYAFVYIFRCWCPLWLFRSCSTSASYRFRRLNPYPSALLSGV